MSNNVRHLPVHGQLTRAECKTWVEPCRLTACRFNLTNDAREGHIPEQPCLLNLINENEEGLGSELSEQEITSALGYASTSTVHGLIVKALAAYEKRAKMAGIVARDEPKHPKMTAPEKLFRSLNRFDHGATTDELLDATGIPWPTFYESMGVLRAEGRATQVDDLWIALEPKKAETAETEEVAS